MTSARSSATASASAYSRTWDFGFGSGRARAGAASRRRRSGLGMPAHDRRACHQPPPLSTARKASWGISTPPHLLHAPLPLLLPLEELPLARDVAAVALGGHV